MRSPALRLPTRFPIGTRYVIEGRGGRIRLRYLEFPDGRQVELPIEGPRRVHGRASTGRHRSRRRA